MTAETKTELQGLLEARYTHPPKVDLRLNQTLDTLLSHRSVRAFTNEPLPANTLELLIAAAQSASSSSNLQTWSVVAVEDQERKERLAKFAGDQKHIRTCPLFLVWVADLARLSSLGQKREVAHESLNYLELFLVAALDSALAAQNAAVAAEAMGLGIVYIGGMRNQPELVAKELHLPERAFATFGMCVGHPDPERPATIKPRLSQSAVLHREAYDPSTLDAAVDSYNVEMTRFYAEEGMKNRGPWDLHSLNRVRGPAAMAGRDRLVEALNSLGFALN